MSGYQYSTPFNGTLPALPYDFLRHATDPGRNIAAGMESFGNSISGAITKYLDKKEQNQAADQRLQDLLGILHNESTSGNLMDKNTPESKLLSGVMRMTKTDSPDALMDFVGKVPSMPLEKKKALAFDLQFMLDRHDKNKAQGAEIAYRDALTKNIINEMNNRTALAQAQNEILSQPTQQSVMGPVYENAFLPDVKGPTKELTPESKAAQFWMNKAKINAMQSMDEAVKAKQEYGAIMNRLAAAAPEGQVPLALSMADPDNRSINSINDQIEASRRIMNAPALKPTFAEGMIPVAGPSRKEVGVVEVGKTPISYYDQFVSAAKSMASRGLPVDVNSVNAIIASKGTNPPLPNGMVPVASSQTVGNTTISSENVPVKMAEMQARMAPQLAERVVNLNPVVGGGTAMAPSSKSAEELRDVGKQLSDGLEAIDFLIEKTGKFGHSLNLKDKAVVDPYYNQLISSLRAAWVGPGAVSNQERELMTKAIRNPNEFFSYDSATKENLKTVRGVLLRGYQHKLQMNGINVGGSQQNQTFKDYTGDNRLR